LGKSEGGEKSVRVVCAQRRRCVDAENAPMDLPISWDALGVVAEEGVEALLGKREGADFSPAVEVGRKSLLGR
jgi:hypothetical protein